MPSIGNWVVSVSLKLKSDIGTQVGDITKSLQQLREGEVSKVQSSFNSLGNSIALLGKRIDADGNVLKGTVLSSLSSGLTSVTKRTTAASEAMNVLKENLAGVAGDAESSVGKINDLAGALGRIGRSGGGGGGRARGGSHGGGGIGGFLTGLFTPQAMMGLDPMMIGMSLQGALLGGLHTSAEFQQYLNVAANMGDMKAAQKAHWAKQILQVSGMTGIDPAEMMHSSLDVVRLMKGTMTIDQMADLQPKMFKAAKVLEVTRGYSPTKSIDNLVEMAHMLHNYNQDRVSSMMDLMLGASELISQDPAKLKTQMGYFASGFKNAGVSDKDIFTSIVMASRAGMGTGKGGTSLQNFISATLGQADITNFRAALRKESVQKIIGGDIEHFYYADKAGGPKTLHIMDMLQNLSRYATSHPGWQSIPELNKAFGVQGGRFASMLSDPETVKAFAGTRKAMDDPNMSVENLYKSVMNNFLPQADRAKNSFSVLGTSLGPTLLPSMTNVARSFSDMMVNIAQVVNKNPHVLDGVRHMLDGLANVFVHIDKYVQKNPKSISQLFDGIKIVGEGIMLLAGWRMAAGTFSFLKGAVKGVMGFFDGVLWIGARVAPLLLRIAPMIMRVLPLLMGVPGIVAAVVIGLTVLGIWAYQNRDKIGKALIDIRDKISNGTKWVLDGLGNWWNSIVKFFQDRLHIGGGGPNTTGPPSAHPSPPPPPPPRSGPPKVSAHTPAHPTHVAINFYGNVYGKDEIHKHVQTALAESGRHPMTTLSNNLSPTRTNPRIPQFLTVKTA